MTEQLEAIKARFEQVGVALTNPEIINNKKEFEKFRPIQDKAFVSDFDRLVKRVSGGTQKPENNYLN